ncbi:CPBP family intramembrane metalloprotease [bacterium]|nr:CPBP family intramembrane metalloprotease [bacterium]
MINSDLPQKSPFTVIIKVIALLFVFQFLMGLTTVIGYIIEGDFELLAENKTGAFEFPNHRILAWSGLTLLLVGLPVAGLIGRYAMRSRPAKFFFMETSWIKFGWGAAGGILLSTSVISIVALMGHAELVGMPGRLIPQEIWASILGYGLLMIFVGLYEELLYRGFLACEWSHRAGSWAVGITFSGLLFGMMHMFNVQGTVNEKVRIVVSGLLFSWFLAAIMLRFKSIKAAIGVHAGWNFGLGCLMGCVVSGQRFNMTPFQTDIYGPEWLTGGVFGLETSLLLNVILLLLTWLIWRGIDFEEIRESSVLARKTNVFEE